jgi:hypothetical protein
MTVEHAIDYGNQWAYFYCDTCDTVSLAGAMNLEELNREKELFEKEHRHENL